MKVIDASFEIMSDFDGVQMLKNIEKAARTCYKSENLINDNSYVSMIKNILVNGHLSVLEHEKVTVKIICDRGVSHELVRHRIASYSQESTRYCNYSKEKFGNELTFISPCFWDDEVGYCPYDIWADTMRFIEKKYFELLNQGAKPEEARAILPNSIKTEIVMTMNLREWRHFFNLRCSVRAHPQMREIAIPMLHEFQKRIPIVFDDIIY